MQKKKLSSVCQTNCYRSFGFRFGESLQILLFEGFFRMKGEIMFDNTLTIVISHFCIFTEAFLRLIHRSFQLLSSLPWLRFSFHRGEVAAITFGKDEVLPRANGPIVSSGTVHVTLLRYCRTETLLYYSTLRLAKFLQSTKFCDRN